MRRMHSSRSHSKLFADGSMDTLMMDEKHNARPHTNKRHNMDSRTNACGWDLEALSLIREQEMASREPVFVFKGTEETESLLGHVETHWQPVRRLSTPYRKPSAFERRNKCEHFETISEAFAALDKVSNGIIQPENVSENMNKYKLVRFTIQDGRVSHDPP